MTTYTSPPEEVGAVPTLAMVDLYEEWKRGEGVPLVTGFYIEDLNTVELGPWPRKGGRGAIINLEGTGGVNDTHVVELPPGGSSNPERHMYEEMIHVLSGRGATTIWYDEKQKQTFEWGRGALFAPPLNAWSQHHNGSGTEPVRYISVTNLPTILKIFHNWDFVWDNPFVFKDRFADESGYFSGEGKLFRHRIWETNFVPDVNTTRLYSWAERGAGGANIFLELAQNSMGAHISQFPVRTYKKAHRHGPGAHVMILDGTGYTLLWKEGAKERKKCEWKPGSLVVPPDNWFHEHFNTGTKPARYLALRFTGRRYLQPGPYEGAEGADLSITEGGWQIEYSDEDPEIHRLFEEDLARNGATCHMRGMVPWCTGEAAPAPSGGG